MISDKRPYKLDLNAPNRTPDILPKVGDWVKIKSEVWYNKWRHDKNHIALRGCIFNRDMALECGRVMQVVAETTHYGIKFYKLGGSEWSWTLEMFEEVYPQNRKMIQRTRFLKIKML